MDQRKTQQVARRDEMSKKDEILMATLVEDEPVRVRPDRPVTFTPSKGRWDEAMVLLALTLFAIVFLFLVTTFASLP